MSTNRHINKICVAAIVTSLVLTLIFMSGASLGIVSAGSTGIMGYEDRLFDTSSVHTIDIVMDDWDSFIETCESEEYSLCAVIIDGESYGNIGIRAKGNTSLSSVRSMGSQRYSFKLEFDHYEDGKSYHGLDKLSLNNLIQDNTMMKDYLVYRMMGDFGVDSPLCSYVYITVNGEEWGLYLAVEGVEDSFLWRNYGSDSGELYKPDSLSFGGGRGNGRDFNFDDFDFDDMDSWDMPQGGGMPRSSRDSGDGSTGAGQSMEGGQFQTPGGGAFPGGGFSAPPDGSMTQEGSMPQSGSVPQDGSVPQMPGGSGEGLESLRKQPGAEDKFPGGPDGEGNFESFEGFGGFDGDFGGFGGMGSDDVKLKYIDDDADSYSNIFNNAKTEITDTDRQRLISALKNLSEYADLENTVDTDEVLRYFVVHNFVCNSDSYTGAMIHNYYLHEQNGQLAMIPWDYNLAFGTFEGGDGGSSVNASIDNPVSGGSVDDRPMLGWIFSDAGYTERYHELFSEFIDHWFSEGQLAQLIRETQTLLQPFVEKDPTKFCTVEEFETGVQTLEEFVALRAEAVNRQLSGDTSMVDTGGLDTSAMGSMGGTGGGFDTGSGRAPSFNPGAGGSGPNQGFPDMQPGGMAPWGNSSSYAAGGSSTVPAFILLGISVVVLFTGLFAAIRVRR